MAETIISLRPIHAFHSISPPLMHPASPPVVIDKSGALDAFTTAAQ